MKLSTICLQPNDILIILNDNDMAIDDNVGGMRDYLVKMTTSPTYNRVRNDVYQKFKKGNLITEQGKNLILRFNNKFEITVDQTTEHV